MLPVLFCCPPPSPNIRHQPQLQRGCGLHELFLPVTLTALQAGAVSGLSRCFGVRMEFYPNLAVWRLLLSLVRPPEHSQHSSTLRSLALSCFLPSLRCSSELFHLCSRSLLFGWGTLAGTFSLWCLWRNYQLRKVAARITAGISIKPAGVCAPGPCTSHRDCGIQLVYRLFTS